MNYYKILNINANATKDEIKNAYKKIALKCHPDKLTNIKDENVKNEMINKFKNATEAYNYLKNNYYDYGDNTDPYDWDDTIVFFKDIINVFNKYKCSKIIKHNFTLDVLYSEVYNNIVKKIRIFLKNIEQPVNIEMICGKYPKIIKNYIDDDGIEHEIIINMQLINDENNNDFVFNHTINNNSVDIYTDLNISIVDYLIGYKNKYNFIDGSIIDLNIPNFTNKWIIKNKGINNGDFILNIKYNFINKKNWECINDTEKNEMIRILSKMI